MRRLALVSLLPLAAIAGSALVAGCSDEGCSGVGCGPPLAIELRRDRWEPGVWQVGVDGAVVCTWEVPAPAEPDPARCPGGEDPYVSLAAELEEVTVSLVHDGRPVASRTIRPSYEESGDECLTCRSAHEVVEY